MKGFEGRGLHLPHTIAAMAKRIVIALILAVPIEYVNIYVFPFPIDVGLAPGAGPVAQIWSAVWGILHASGLILNSRLDPYDHLHLFFPALLLSGYLDSALLIFGGIYAFLGIRRVVRRVSARRSADLRG